MSLDIPSADPAEWIELLKPYQRNTITAFVSQGSLEDAAKKWLSATGSPNIVPFGGSGDTKPFWDRFATEFKKFVCDDAAYTEEKKALGSESAPIKALLISAMSAAIGATLGYAATLLAPAVALLLCIVGQMGKNAYCAGVDVG
jgi:hypothetical protein